MWRMKIFAGHVFLSSFLIIVNLEVRFFQTSSPLVQTSLLDDPVPDRDGLLHLGRDRAGMTLIPAGTGTGMTSKNRPGPGSG